MLPIAIAIGCLILIWLGLYFANNRSETSVEPTLWETRYLQARTLPLDFRLSLDAGSSFQYIPREDYSSLEASLSGVSRITSIGTSSATISNSFYSVEVVGDAAIKMQDSLLEIMAIKEDVYVTKKWTQKTEVIQEGSWIAYSPEYSTLIHERTEPNALLLTPQQITDFLEQHPSHAFQFAKDIYVDSSNFPIPVIPIELADPLIQQLDFWLNIQFERDSSGVYDISDIRSRSFQ